MSLSVFLGQITLGSKIVFDCLRRLTPRSSAAARFEACIIDPPGGTDKLIRRRSMLTQGWSDSSD